MEPTQSPLLWQLIALVCALGWTATLYLLLRRRVVSDDKEPQKPSAPSMRVAYKSLLAACIADQAEQARKHLIQWVAATWEDPAITSLERAARAVDDPALSAQAAALEKALYGRASDQWQGAELKSVIEQLHRRGRRDGEQDTDKLRLYPT